VAEEEGREVVRGAIEGADRVATSTVAYVETRAALARKEREGDLDEEGCRRAGGALDDEWSRYDRLAVSNLVAYRAGEMAERYALRGFDAIHLASAARLRERFDDLRFMAFDRRLTDAAHRVLPVYEER
jgi:uncharacterized protein